MIVVRVYSVIHTQAHEHCALWTSVYPWITTRMYVWNVHQGDLHIWNIRYIVWPVRIHARNYHYRTCIIVLWRAYVFVCVCACSQEHALGWCQPLTCAWRICGFSSAFTHTMRGNRVCQFEFSIILLCGVICSTHRNDVRAQHDYKLNCQRCLLQLALGQYYGNRILNSTIWDHKKNGFRSSALFLHDSNFLRNT